MKITLSRHYKSNDRNFINSPEALAELFSIAKELKFDGVDYIATIPDILLKPQKAVSLSNEYNVPILSVHAPMHLLLFTPGFLQKPLLHMFRYFPYAEVFNFHLSGFITPLQKNGKNVKRFVRSAKESDIPLSFESNPLLKGLGNYPKVTYDPENFAEYCLANNMPITFDTAHIAHCNYDIVTFFKKYHKYIKLIHLSDSIGAVQHLPLGKGNLPIKELLQEIKRKSYNALIAFEICTFPKAATREEKTKELKNSLDMVKKYAF